jgi:hypothetical protein
MGAFAGMLLGAAAGAGTGYAVSHNNNKKCHKVIVQNTETCSSQCEQDKGEQLIFEISLALDVNLFLENIMNESTSLPGQGRLKVTSFVVDPRGTMTNGRTEVLTLQRENMRIGADNEIPIDRSFQTSSLVAYQDFIALSDPYLGTYNFGLQCEFSNLPTLSFIVILGDVKSSKTQTTTAIPINLPLSYGVSGLTFTQVQGVYEYGRVVPSIRSLANQE